jgi:hypothetical protein
VCTCLAMIPASAEVRWQNGTATVRECPWACCPPKEMKKRCLWGGPRLAADAHVGPAEDSRNRPTDSVFNEAFLTGPVLDPNHMPSPRTRSGFRWYPMRHIYVAHPFSPLPRFGIR